MVQTTLLASTGHAIVTLWKNPLYDVDVTNVIDSDIRHRSSQNSLRSHEAQRGASTTFWRLWIRISIRVQTMLNNCRFVFFNTTSTSHRTILSGSDHCATRWRGQRCPYYHRRRQIGQSDCDITANCGKNVISVKNSYHTLNKLGVTRPIWTWLFAFPWYSR